MNKLQKLHPIDAFGIQKVSMSGIRVERLEDRLKPGVAFPHKHDFFQIMLVTQGSGEHQIDFKNHKVQVGQIYMMKPGQMHSWDLSRGIKGIIIEFNYQSLHIVKDFSLSPDVFLVTDKKKFSELITLCEIMIRESDQKLDRYDECLQGYVTAFLINLMRLTKASPKQAKSLTTIEKFRELLEKNYKSQHSVEFYASKLNTSTKALTMQFSRSIGKPPREIIYDRILLEAKRYLAFSQLTVAEIGYELGFDDANYFGRFFRVHEKKTPAQFRKER